MFALHCWDLAKQRVVDDAVTAHCCLHGIEVQTSVISDAVWVVKDAVTAQCCLHSVKQQTSVRHNGGRRVIR